jgi:hypothetical protein
VYAEHVLLIASPHFMFLDWMEPLVPHLWNVTSLEESFGLCTSLVWLENSDVFQKSFSHTVLSGVPQTVNVSISMSAEDVCLNRLKNW